MRALLFAALLASPAVADTIDPRYKEIGTFVGTIGDTTLSLSSLIDLEKDRSMIRRNGTGGATTLGISARNIANDGTPTNPGISFTIGPLGRGERSDIFYNDETGYYVADVDQGNRADLADFVLTDTAVSFTVRADLIPVNRGDEGFVKDGARTNQTVEGTFSGTIPTPR